MITNGGSSTPARGHDVDAAGNGEVVAGEKRGAAIGTPFPNFRFANPYQVLPQINLNLRFPAEAASSPSHAKALTSTVAARDYVNTLLTLDEY